MSEEKMCTSVRMVFLSNLWESKGILDLLDALVLLRQRGHQFVCDVIGMKTAEISEERMQMEIARRDLQGLVVYKGSMYDNGKMDELDRADIFVFPTYNDCFPLVLLEAMAHSLPCVSTDEGAIANIIDDGRTGLIVKKKDPQDLADKLELLMNDKALRQQMGEAGRRKYENEYTLEHFERNFLGCMRAVCLEV